MVGVLSAISTIIAAGALVVKEVPVLSILIRRHLVSRADVALQAPKAANLRETVLLGEKAMHPRYALSSRAEKHTSMPTFPRRRRLRTGDRRLRPTLDGSIKLVLFEWLRDMVDHTRCVILDHLLGQYVCSHRNDGQISRWVL